jgi:hypothetical protein
MARHGSFTEEELGSDLAIGSALGDETGDPELRRAQAFDPLTPADPRELGVGRRGPAGGAEGLEPFQGSLEGCA